MGLWAYLILEVQEKQKKSWLGCFQDAEAYGSEEIRKTTCYSLLEDKRYPDGSVPAELYGYSMEDTFAEGENSCSDTLRMYYTILKMV